MSVVPANVETPKFRSQTGEAYQALRSAIVSGDLSPGLRLSPADLSARFGLGPTPIREALSRLSAENLAVSIEQRGFRVAPLSSRELRELLALRLGFERDAMFRSMREGGDAWEAGIVSAYHLLARCTPPEPGTTLDAFNLWGQRHDAFHLAIIDGCDAPWLRRFHRMAVDQIERYRIAILRQPGRTPAHVSLTRLLSHQDHAALRDAVLSRDAARADTALSAHVGETAEIFAEMFEVYQTGSDVIG